MGASVHIKNDFGLYPIHLAASRGNKELCRVLLSYKEVVIDTTDQGLVCIQIHFCIQCIQKTLFSCKPGKVALRPNIMKLLKRNSYYVNKKRD